MFLEKTVTSLPKILINLPTKLNNVPNVVDNSVPNVSFNNGMRGLTKLSFIDLARSNNPVIKSNIPSNNTFPPIFQTSFNKLDTASKTYEAVSTKLKNKSLAVWKNGRHFSSTTLNIPLAIVFMLSNALLNFFSIEGPYLFQLFCNGTNISFLNAFFAISAHLSKVSLICVAFIRTLPKI